MYAKTWPAMHELWRLKGIGLWLFARTRKHSQVHYLFAESWPFQNSDCGFHVSNLLGCSKLSFIFISCFSTTAMSAFLRRIDLSSKLLAPIVAGQVSSVTSGFSLQEHSRVGAADSSVALFGWCSQCFCSLLQFKLSFWRRANNGWCRV